MTDNKMRKPVRDVTIADVAEKVRCFHCYGIALSRKGRYSGKQHRVEGARNRLRTNHMAKSLKRKRTEQIALRSQTSAAVYLPCKSIQQVVKDQIRLILLSTKHWS